MGKGFWKFFIATNLEWMWIAKSGYLGEEARQAEAELEEELGPIFAIFFALLIFGLAVWGLLSLFGLV